MICIFYSREIWILASACVAQSIMLSIRFKIFAATHARPLGCLAGFVAPEAIEIPDPHIGRIRDRFTGLFRHGVTCAQEDRTLFCDSWRRKLLDLADRNRLDALIVLCLKTANCDRMVEPDRQM